MASQCTYLHICKAHASNVACGLDWSSYLIDQVIIRQLGGVGSRPSWQVCTYTERGREGGREREREREADLPPVLPVGSTGLVHLKHGQLPQPLPPGGHSNNHDIVI